MNYWPNTTLSITRTDVIETYGCVKLALWLVELKENWSRTQKWKYFINNILLIICWNDKIWGGGGCCYLVTELCQTLLQPHGLYPTRLSAHGISQANILEWVVLPFSRGSSQSRDQINVSCIRRQIFYHWATREAQYFGYISLKKIYYLNSICFTFLTWPSSIYNYLCSLHYTSFGQNWSSIK